MSFVVVLFFVLLFVCQVLVILRFIVSQESISRTRLPVMVVIVVDSCGFDLLQVLDYSFYVLLNIFSLVHVLLIRNIYMYFVCRMVVERVLILRYFIFNVDP